MVAKCSLKPLSIRTLFLYFHLFVLKKYPTDCFQFIKRCTLLCTFQIGCCKFNLCGSDHCTFHHKEKKSIECHDEDLFFSGK